MRRNRKSLLLEKSRLQPVAANGLLDRRAFLSDGAAMAAGFTPYALARPARGEPLKDDPWSLGPGNLTGPYEQRSRFEDKVVRTLSNPKGEPARAERAHAIAPHAGHHHAGRQEDICVPPTGRVGVTPASERNGCEGHHGRYTPRWPRTWTIEKRTAGTGR
jgi:hypothetical protein